MAEAKKAEGEIEAVPKKKSKLLLLIAIAVLLVVLIGGGVAYLLLSRQSADTGEAGVDAATAEEEVLVRRDEETPPVFVKLDTFTVKLQSEGQEAYLQTVPELRVLDVKVDEQVKAYMPEIRHKVLLILAGKTASDLSTPQGVQQLANEIRVTINGILQPSPQRTGGRLTANQPLSDRAGPEDPVQAVLFTSFIIQ
jgi:flagellar FliL protein